MSRVEENRKHKGFIKRRVCFALTVFLLMTVGLVAVDYLFYKNVEGMRTVSIFNILVHDDYFKFVLFGKELVSIPIR